MFGNTTERWQQSGLEATATPRPHVAAIRREAGTDIQDSLKIDAQEPCSGAPASDDDTTVSSYDEEGLGDWLAGGHPNSHIVVRSGRK